MKFSNYEILIQKVNPRLQESTQSRPRVAEMKVKGQFDVAASQLPTHEDICVAVWYINDPTSFYVQVNAFS